MGAGSLSVTDSCIQRPAIVSVLRTDLIVYCYGNSYHLLSVSGSTFEQAAKYSTFCSMSTHMVDFCTSWDSRYWERHERSDMFHFSAKHYPLIQNYTESLLFHSSWQCSTEWLLCWSNSHTISDNDMRQTHWPTCWGCIRGKINLCFKPLRFGYCFHGVT